MRRLFLLTVLLVLPQFASAANTTVWELQNQQKIEGWNMNNLTEVSLLKEGLVVTTQTEGQLIKPTDISHSVDTVAISYISLTGGKGMFLWRPPHFTGSQVFQVPIVFDRSQTTQRMVLDLSNIPEWDPQSDRMGFVIGANSQVVLQRVEFTGPSFVDYIVYPLKTFFKFDQIRPYSVNFLWGPLMTYRADQLASLFAVPPPNGDSWNWMFYSMFAAGGLLIFWARKQGKSQMVTIVVAVACSIWILYDVRMGAEMMSYAKKDLKTWWSKPIELRQYRDRGSFTAFTQMIKPYLEGEDYYVFMASRGWPFQGAMRYEQYPALPVAPDNAENVRTWVVYDKPGVTLDTDNRITLENGNAISPPGEILFNYARGAFVFRTFPQQEPAAE